MNTHVSVEALMGLAADELDPAEVFLVEAHVRACPSCESLLARMRHRLPLLESLDVGAIPERDLWPGIAAGMDRAADYGATSRRWRAFAHMRRIAAAVTLVALGGWAGRVTAPASHDPSGAVPERPVPATAALGTVIQRAGTEYVAGVASLRLSAPWIPLEERDQATRAAIAVIYGAAHELAQLSPADPVAAELGELAASLRYRPRTSMPRLTVF